MGCRFGGTTLGVVAIMVGLGCAQGMPGPDEFGVEQRLSNPMAVLPVTGAGAGGAAAPNTPPPPFAGIACKQGDTVPCMCADGVSSGVLACVFSTESPTGGVLGEMCQRCTPPAAPPAAGMGGDNGSAGANGSSGSASAAGSGGMSAGSGGAAGGRAGSGGMAGSTMTPMCDEDDCPGTTGLFGIEREPCCTRGGKCGGINGLTGSCETD